MPTKQSIDITAFRDFERAGWETNIAEYDSAFARLTSQAAEPLLNAAAVHQGVRVLDIATGPGYVASLAAARGARVVGVDFSASMVAYARRMNPGIEFAQGDAEGLSFAAGTFDAVVMNFGVLHLARPEVAMAEAARVLRPGGRFAFTAWAQAQDVVGFALILAAVQAHGNPAVDVPQGPPFFRFSDADECERTLHAAGFVDVNVEKIPQMWRFAAPKDLFDSLYNAGVRMRAVLRAQSPAALLAIREAVDQGVRAYLQAGVVEMPMPAVLASATKPKAV